MKGHRTARRLPWKAEPMTLLEHFGFTAFITVGWVFPYLMAAL